MNVVMYLKEECLLVTLLRNKMQAYMQIMLININEVVTTMNEIHRVRYRK